MCGIKLEKEEQNNNPMYIKVVGVLVERSVVLTREKKDAF
jgi:hypothetical protein